MPTGEVHVGDIGTKFIFTFKDEQAAGQVVLPIGVSDTHFVVFKKPDRTTKQEVTTRVGDGTAGKVSFTTDDANDLDQAGRWEAQAELTVITPSEIHRSEIVEFVVHKNL